MGRKLHGVEKGFRIYLENSDTYVDFLVGSATPAGTGDQADAPIGSLYQRIGTGELYQKILNNGNAGDWELNGAGTTSVVPVFKNIVVRAATGEALTAGVRDLVANPFTDDEAPLLVAADFQVGQYIIGGVGGTPILYRVDAVAAPNITISAASPVLADNDGFIVRSYLPDSPGSQEEQALVVYQNGAIIKLADVNWNFATGINLSSGYAVNNSGAAISSADSVESAIAKLDGRSSKRSQVAGITTAQTVDSVLVDDVKAVHWKVHVFENANPNRIKVYEVYATHNGTAAADATIADDTQYSILKLGSNFNLSLDVDLNGVGAAQVMRLRAASTTAGVTVTAIRENVI